MKIKVLYVHHDGIITGSAISLLNILNKLDRDRFEPLVVTGAQGPYNTLLNERGIPNTVTPFTPYMTQPTPSLFNPDYISNYRTLLRKVHINETLAAFQPDVIHVNDKAALPFMMHYRHHAKVVWHFRSAFAGKHSQVQYLLCKWLIQKKADHIITISEDETDGFEHFKNLSVIFNSIDIDASDKVIAEGATFRQEMNISRDAIAVGMFGNLNQQKGAWNFLRAAALAHQQAPQLNLQFFMIAPIPPAGMNWGIRGRLKLIDTTHPYDKAMKMVKDLGLEGRVFFTNRRNDVLNVMRGLDIVTACYDMYAIGRPAFEAMSVGRAVIVNKGHSGRSSVVRDGETGLIVSKENPQQLADAMLKLANDAALRERIGQNGLHYAREYFSAEKNTRRIEALYESLLAGKHMA